MVDTTKTSDRDKSASDLTEAGAPAIKITPAMIEAGERAIFSFGVDPHLSTGDWAASLAEMVYRAMRDADCSKLNQSQSHSPAKR